MKAHLKVKRSLIPVAAPLTNRSLECGSNISLDATPNSALLVVKPSNLLSSWSTCKSESSLLSHVEQKTQNNFMGTNEKSAKDIKKNSSGPKRHSYSSSSNFKIKIYHSATDLVKKTINPDNEECSIPSSDTSTRSSNVSKMAIQSSVNKLSSTSSDQTSHRHGSSASSTATMSESQSSNLMSCSDDLSYPSRLQMERQLKKQDLYIAKLLESAKEKEKLIDNLYFEIDSREERIVELVDEIKKRKHDMNEMSRRVIDLDRELKMFQYPPVNIYETSFINRPVSQLSFDSNKSDHHTTKSKWAKISKVLKKPLTTNKSKIHQHNNTTDCIEELKSILQEKERIITDLRLESKMTVHRLEELENTLRQKEEESIMIKKNNNYLEKVIKSKLIE